MQRLAEPLTCGFASTLAFAYIYEGTTRRRRDNLAPSTVSHVFAGQKAKSMARSGSAVDTKQRVQTSILASLQIKTGADWGTATPPSDCVVARPSYFSGATGTVTGASVRDVPQIGVSQLSTAAEN